MADRIGNIGADDVQSAVVAGTVSLLGFVGLAFVLGVQFSIRQVGWLMFGMVAVGFLAQRTGEISVGLSVITVALALVVVEYAVPGFVVSAFNPILGPVQSITGIELSSIDPLQFFILTVTFVVVMVWLRIRLSGKKKFVDTTTDLTLKEIGRVWQTYVTVTRIVFLFLLSLVAVVFVNAGQAVGEVGNLMAEAPYFASSGLITIFGWLTHGGSLPIVGGIPFLKDISPVGWLFIAGLVIFAAAASREGSSGPVSQFLRRRS